MYVYGVGCHRRRQQLRRDVSELDSQALALPCRGVYRHHEPKQLDSLPNSHFTDDWVASCQHLLER